MTQETNWILVSPIRILHEHYKDFPVCITNELAFVKFMIPDGIFPEEMYNLSPTIGDLIRFSRNDLLKLHGIGKKKVQQIEAWLSQHDLCLNPYDQFEQCTFMDHIIGFGRVHSVKLASTSNAYLWK